MRWPMIMLLMIGPLTNADGVKSRQPSLDEDECLPRWVWRLWAGQRVSGGRDHTGVKKEAYVPVLLLA